uniref:Poly [ADP-ribose] polymerase n=1 Tax=Neolamprologus brichardi TaxID=32507 RepID=A0A3Q4GZX8_NEOBR
ADIEAVKDIYTDSAISVREYGTIDDVDIDLHINISFLDEEVATAWKVIRTEPIILRLRFSLSQYLDGPEPSVEVFQPSNKEGFSLGLQLKKILSTFTSQQWKHLSNEFLKAQQEKRHSWFKAGGTIKKFRAGLSIFSPIPKAPAQITTRQLIELFFSSQAGGHCKNIPTLEYGFLVQIMKYSEQRIPTLNEYCVVCDEQHVFQNGSMLKPAVCTRELCVFSFYTLGVMSGAAEEVATGAEVVDLLVAMCRAALESPRKSIIFEPYPSVVDPNDPKTLAFNPKVSILTAFLKIIFNSIMTFNLKKTYCMLKKNPLLPSEQTKIIRFHAITLLYSHGICFIFLSLPLYTCSSGSHIENWHSVLRNGLVNASYTKLQLHGAAYGKGIYLSPISSISFGYSGMGKGQHRMPTKDELVQRYNRMNTIPQSRPIQSRFLQSRNLNCIALCEVITSKDLQKHGNIWVCPVSDHVCTRFFFVYEDGQVGDANINTQEPKVQKEIMRVIGTQIYSS